MLADPNDLVGTAQKAISPAYMPNSPPTLGWMEVIERALSSSADILTIVASLLAIYIFLTKRSEIASFLKTISTFVHQTSLAELRQKLETLSHLNAANAEDLPEIVALFHDICGQVDGSPILAQKFADFAQRVRKSTGKNRTLSEPHKRAFISELREGLRHLDVSSYADSMGEYRK